jgi:hypothetical protein
MERYVRYKGSGLKNTSVRKSPSKLRETITELNVVKLYGFIVSSLLIADFGQDYC